MAAAFAPLPVPSAPALGLGLPRGRAQLRRLPARPDPRHGCLLTSIQKATTKMNSSISST